MSRSRSSIVLRPSRDGSAAGRLSRAAMLLVLLSALALKPGLGARTASASVPAAPPTSYTVTDVGVAQITNPNGPVISLSSQAVSINDSGQVLRGTSASCGFHCDSVGQYDIWKGGVIQTITLPQGVTITSAPFLNNAEQVIVNGGGHAYLWEDGQATRIPELPGQTSGNAQGLNDNGVVVGIDWTSNVATAVGFIWQNGVVSGLGTGANGAQMSPRAVNTDLIAVGQVGLTAASWRRGVIRILGSGTVPSLASAINGDGLIVGQAANRATLWQDGVQRDLGSLAGASGASQGWAINDAGDIVGGSAFPQQGSSTGHAFFWHAGVMTDLNTLIPANSGWELSQANGINASGQIVGNGLHNGERHGFLLTPNATAPQPCGAVSETANPASPQAVGTAVTFTAAAAPCSAPLYQYWVLAPGGAWTVAQPYSSSGVFNWNTTGLAAGTYQVAVWAKQTGSTAAFEWSNQLAYTLTTATGGACNAVSESAAPTSPQARGATIHVTAQASGCPTPQYQFWLQGPGLAWTVKQAYTASSAWDWNTTGLPAGTYQIAVWAKQQGSSASFEWSNQINFILQ